MLDRLRANKPMQLGLGLLMGFIFGFLLQKGGVARYDVILNQLLLKDFTVVKIMMTAVVTGMLGIYGLKRLGLARLQPKPASVGMNIYGGLFFGVSFAVLGYCPGTVAAAAGSGSLDALAGGLGGMLLGTALYAHVYPKFDAKIARIGWMGEITLPQLWKIHEWILVAVFSTAIILLLAILELSGL